MRKQKKKRKVILEKWLIPRLRRISMFWPAINEARDNCKIYMKIGNYRNGKPIMKRYFLCENPDCGCLCDDGEGAVDHIKSVIDVNEGFKNWNEYITRLFCDSDNLQFLCHQCHDNKTAEENNLRELNAKNRIKK